MDITEIDPRLRQEAIGDRKFNWFDVKDDPFRTYGIFFDAERERYARMPQEIADTVNTAVRELSCNTAGGRVRFVTDAPFLALKCYKNRHGPMPHMPALGSHGFAVYESNRFCGYLAPLAAEYYPDTKTGNPMMTFEKVVHLGAAGIKRQITVYFPLYASVSALFVGVEDGFTVSAPAPYTYEEKPVLFYGSSITQGGCASRPGNDYIGLIARKLDTDVLNLGFSGGGKAEPQMNAYLASLDPSVFVMDYDHNASTADYLAATHDKLFRTFRAAHPTTPVVLMTNPSPESFADTDRRREIIRATYRRARRRGDRNVYFLDGKKFWQTVEDYRECCTVDNCHPNDLGFYLMAKHLSPILQKLLAETKQ